MKKLFPVIHHKNDQTTFENAKIAFNEGCAGVFLIEMSGKDDHVIESALELKSKYSDWFVARNCLSINPVEAIISDYEFGFDGLWIDNPGLYSDREDLIVSKINEELKLRPDFAFYGSIAFKTHQYEDLDPGLAAHLASDMGWFPTTSGTATGVAADLAKIRNIRACLHRRLLAIASGITVDNIDTYLPYVDHFLVATGISKSFYEFDIKLVHQMAQKIKEYNKAHH